MILLPSLVSPGGAIVTFYLLVLLFTRQNDGSQASINKPKAGITL